MELILFKSRTKALKFSTISQIRKLIKRENSKAKIDQTVSIEIEFLFSIFNFRIHFVCVLIDDDDIV